MKTYKIKISFKDNSYKYIQANQKKLIKAGNVIKYCFEKYGKDNIKEIKTRLKNSYTNNYYWCLNYSTFFERAKINNLRVERENKTGYEDFTGYGSQTNGKKNRFYIGRSTGWVPIYLEILKNNSSGGGSLSYRNGKFRTL